MDKSKMKVWRARSPLSATRQIAGLFAVVEPYVMRFRNICQADDGIQRLPHAFFVLLLRCQQQFHGLSQRLVPFHKFLKAFVNGHDIPTTRNIIPMPSSADVTCIVGANHG